MPEDTTSVVEHLDRAVQVAQDQEMSASEIIGLLFYYAHNVAQETRESAMRQQRQDQEKEAA